MQLWDPEYTTLPYSFDLIRGLGTGGSRQDTVASDDLRQRFRPGIVFTTQQSPIEMVFTARSPFASPAELRFHLESQGTSPSLRQKIEMFDWDASKYVEVDERAMTVSDSTVDIVRTDSNRFIDDAEQTVRVRVSYRANGPVFLYPWEPRIDRAAWSFEN
jgi:hypothetical protein